MYIVIHLCFFVSNRMSVLQWIGVWAMTGYSKPEKSDLDRWSRGMGYLLVDPKGLHYFKEFLNDPRRKFGSHSKCFSILEDCERLINEEGPIPGTEALAVLKEAEEYLNMSSGDIVQAENDIESGNVDQIRKVIISIREAAKEELDDVYGLFVSVFKEQVSPKKKCIIL
ncbi:hypothetical protein C0J52_13044 [Blattella germanica]|nr:hypothetical protein C0J52_13044 [Blattella germanica]